MLTCLPKSLCTWSFRVLGGASGPAELAFDFFTEQGSLSLGDGEYDIRKHGWTSGHWSIERNGQVCADARKPSAFLRHFEIRTGDVTIMSAADSPLTRCYTLLADGREIGAIRPAHPFTRRAVIECDPSVPELVQLFAFWLAVLTWRRAAHNNAGGSN